MKTYLLYNRQTQGERQMQELARRLEPLKVVAELIDADSPGGIQIAEGFDVLGRPAVIVARDDGSVMQLWEGEQLPAPTDISYLAHQ